MRRFRTGPWRLKPRASDAEVEAYQAALRSGAAKSKGEIVHGERGRGCGGYVIECPWCGRMWGPLHGRRAGFVSAAVGFHLAACARDTWIAGERRRVEEGCA